MLNNLTERLIKNDVERNDTNLLIEGIMLGKSLSTPQRYSMCSMSECGDDELNSFKNKIANVKFSDTMSVEDRKQALLNSIKGQTITESSEFDIDKKLRMYRSEYIKACKNKDEEKKSQLISQIKQLEKIKNR